MNDSDLMADAVEDALTNNDLAAASAAMEELSVHDVVSLIGRTSAKRAAIVFRLLTKDRAVKAFEMLGTALQSELLLALQDEEVAAIFAELDPDDRVELLDELPAFVAARLLSGLSGREHELTTAILGYPHGSVGRRMSPEYVRLHPEYSVERALALVRVLADKAETIYTIPVTDHTRRLVGVVSLRDLLRHEPGVSIDSIMVPPQSATANSDAEAAARLCADRHLIALPIVDNETRLVGILTIDDAWHILTAAEAEDAARAGATEPLRRPYLSTPVSRIARSRVVWLLVLAVSAILTVRVLEVFEATIEQKVVLALFIPLLTGTGGNTGSQAATTITRALAVGDVRSRDVGKVLIREVRVGAVLGLLLGSLGFSITALVYDVPTALVIGSTLLCVCTMAATVGGAMPLIAKALRVDPAVFSTPFISTFCDATGLVIYFTIAKVVLGI